MTESADNIQFRCVNICVGSVYISEEIEEEADYVNAAVRTVVKTAAT